MVTVLDSIAVLYLSIHYLQGLVELMGAGSIHFHLVVHGEGGNEAVTRLDILQQVQDLVVRLRFLQ